MGSALDVTIYYCWACDAHCKPSVDSHGQPACPHCQRRLSPDARVIRRGKDFGESRGPHFVSPAPLRPRLAG